jgi:hypothetical protein
MSADAFGMAIQVLGNCLDLPTLLAQRMGLGGRSRRR